MSIKHKNQRNAEAENTALENKRIFEEAQRNKAREIAWRNKYEAYK